MPIMQKSIFLNIDNKEATEHTVTSLSKNYIALELSSKQIEIRKKLQICPNHPNEPLRYFSIYQKK